MEGQKSCINLDAKSHTRGIPYQNAFGDVCFSPGCFGNYGKNQIPRKKNL